MNFATGFARQTIVSSVSVMDLTPFELGIGVYAPLGDDEPHEAPERSLPFEEAIMTNYNPVCCCPVFVLETREFDSCRCCRTAISILKEICGTRT
jgi:hypothetical protein